MALAGSGTMTPGMRSRSERLARHTAYATRTYPGWDNLNDINLALDALERGDFSQPAIMFDQMFRDDRFHGTARTRLNALHTVPLDVKPADKRAKSRRIADMLGGFEEGPTLWDRMFPAAENSRLLKWGLGIGIGVGELLWNTEGRLWVPRLKVWHPQYLRWDEGIRRYRMQTMEGDVLLPDIQSNVNSDGHWVVFTPYGYSDAWLEGMIRGMGELVMDRRHGKGDWGHYNEKYGKPIDKVTAPSGWNQTEKDDVLEAVANRNGNTTFLAERDEKGMVVDLEVVEAKSTGWDTFQSHKKESDNDIAIMWLGQNLTTEVAQGKGSLGVPGHEMVRRDLLKFDAHITTTLREQALWHWARLNFGDGELAPLPIYRVEPPEDQVGRATAQAALATAISTLVTAKAQDSRAVPVDFRRMIEESGCMPALSEEEVAAEAAVRAEETEASGGDGGADGGDGGGEGADGADGGAPAADAGNANGDAPAAAPGSLKLTPSTQGAVITVNEARAASGLGPKTDSEGNPDPDGNLIVSDYLAKQAAELENAPAGDQPVDDGAPVADGSPDGQKKKAKVKTLAADTKRTIMLCRRWMRLTLAAKLPEGVAQRRMFAGLSIAVENKAGTYRYWHDTDGNESGRTLMRHDYGYIEGVKGADKEELDCYLGPDESAKDVHIVHQSKRPGYKAYDEDKLMIGWHSADEARQAFAYHRDDGEASIMSMSSIPMDRFKAKLARRKPTSTSKIHASARHRSVLALTALVERTSREMMALRAARAPSPKKLAYADGLVRNAIAIGARSLSADLAGIKADLAKAKSFDEARAIILRRYGKTMKPDKLADVIEKTRLMSALAGHLSAVKES